MIDLCLIYSQICFPALRVLPDENTFTVTVATFSNPQNNKEEDRPVALICEWAYKVDEVGSRVYLHFVRSG